MTITYDIIEKLRKKGELMICRICEREVWINWMEKKIKKKVGKKCAPCFFGTREV